MRKLNITLDENGYILNYVEIGTLNAPTIEVEVEEFDDTNFRFYKYADGKLTFDQAKYDAWLMA